MPLWKQSQHSHVVLFQHVAKCGGTSLVEHLGRLGNRGLCLGFDCRTKTEVEARAKKMLRESGVDVSRIRAVFGHRVFFGLHDLFPTQSRYVTMLRDPVSRVISLYNHHAGIACDPNHALHERDRQVMTRGGELIGFDEWFETAYSGNHMVRFLYYAMAGDLVDPPGPMQQEHLDTAKSFVDQCWYVATTETSETDFQAICAAVDLKPPRRRVNVSKTYFEPPDDESFRRQVEQREALDLELYQYACARRSTLLGLG